MQLVFVFFFFFFPVVGFCGCKSSSPCGGRKEAENSERSQSTLPCLILGHFKRSWFARVNSLRARRPEKSQLPLPGRFLSKHWFTLCITTEAEPNIWQHYKYHYCCICKNDREKMMKDWGEGVVVVSLHRRVVKNAFFVHPKARATSSCLLQNTLWIRPLQKCL